MSGQRPGAAVRQVAALAAAAALALAPAVDALAGHTCGASAAAGHAAGVSGGHVASGSHPVCTDETDLVGYRRCTKYGAWGNNDHVPLFLVELGAVMRTFASPLGESTGRISHNDESFTYRLVDPASGAHASPESALVSTARVGFGMPRRLYVAAEGELGGLVRNASRAEMTSAGMFGTPTLVPGASLVVGALGVLGVRGDTHHGAFGVEVAGGVRSISYRYDSHYLACEATATHEILSPILETRARAGFWLSPFVNVGATAGASVIDRGAWMAGVSLGFVTQAFGNLRD